MSLVLEGAVRPSEGGLEWHGTWKFAKDKRREFPIHYKCTSKAVPRELYNEVSFLTDNTSAPEAAAEDRASNIHNTGDIELKGNHKLIGTWEGYFTVKGEEVVKETFFFYTIIENVALPVQENLRDLPATPFFTYFTIKQSDFSKKLQYMTSKLNVNKLLKNTDDGPPSSVVDTPQTPAVSTSETSQFTVLAGFGRNALGRFTIVIAYDESTGYACCEKKYIYSKVPIKRLPRQNSENKAENNVINSESSGRAVRIRHAPSYSYEDVIAEPTYKRTKSLKIKTDNNGDNEGSALDSTKHHSDAFEGYQQSAHYNFDGYKSAYLDEETGEIYEGEWSCGYKHGRGICLYPDLVMYEGNWVFGKPSGLGLLMSSKREIIYEGEFLDGKLHGRGRFCYANGDQYTGEWREGERQGHGEYVFSNGCRYVGDWKDNDRHGKGKFLWPDGSVYDGEWESNSRHGKGMLELVDGFQYDGYWAHNYMDGRGTQVFVSGTEYQGTFKNGLREGRGSVKFQGAEYEGRFKEDRIDGHGTIKVTSSMRGVTPDEIFIPIEIQADIKRIHYKAGFGEGGH
jgi:hypothetical protein